MSPIVCLCLLLSLSFGCRNKSKNENNPDSSPGPKVVTPAGSQQQDPTRTPAGGANAGDPSVVSPGDATGRELPLQEARIDHIASADVSGDGRDDLVYFTDKGVAVALSDGAGWLAPTLWTLDFAWGPFDASPRLLGDVNGDGKADIVGFSGTGSFLATSTGRQFASLSKVSDEFARDSASPWSGQNIHPRFLADVNGDGLADIVGCKDLGCYVSLADDATPFATVSRRPWIDDFARLVDGTTSSEGWLTMDQYPRALADVDGDRRADMLGFGERGVWVSYSLGTSLQPKEVDGLVLAAFGERSSRWSRQSSAPRLVGDLDGDGRADILGFDSEGNVYLARGATAFSSVERLRNDRLLELVAEFDLAGKSLQELPRLLLDMDGDGADELVMIGGAGRISQLDIRVIDLP